MAKKKKPETPKQRNARLMRERKKRLQDKHIEGNIPETYEKAKNPFGTGDPVEDASRYSRLAVLKREEILEINQMIMDSKPLNSVAEKIKDEWGYHEDLSHDSLRRTLWNYKTKVLDPKMVAASHQRADRVEKTLAVMVENIDSIKEFRSVVAIARRRIDEYLIAREKGERPLMDVDKALMNYARMCKMLNEVELDNGIRQRAPRTVAAHIQFQQSAAEAAYIDALEVEAGQQKRAKEVLDLLTQQGAITDADILEDEPKELEHVAEGE